MFSNPATDQTGSSTDQSTDELTGSVSDWWWLLAVGLTAVTLCLPFSRYVWFLGDEGVLLHAAERMLGGDRIYVDFFEFLPPGGFIITEAWFGMAGISLISARMLAILTIAGIACFTYLACRQSSKCALLSALIAVAWVIISQGSWTQVNHHWFTTLFSMVAAWTTLYSIGHPHLRLRWLVAAGIAVGGATMVTPTRGALAVLAVATPFVNYRRYRRELAAIFCGAAVIPICVLGYLLLHGELTAAFNDIIIFGSFEF